ncbi:hypothetical protein RND81_06G242700 [Saponaria officinalis]|uniref:AT-hook motif nuclear-localized protein n=1 Tax=Saponaria officinalis TaxID=3572 RepID=A0AAW1KFZ1_SAPOF
MDGREGMTLQGSTPYYLHRAISGAQQQGHVGNLTPPPQQQQQQGYRATNPNFSGTQPLIRPTFDVESGSQSNNGPQNPPQGFTITVANSGGSFGEPIKKKRGRPRKYGPDGPGSVSGSGTGTVSLGLSPSSPNSGGLASDRKKRGRPPGSGRKQRLASVGEWMNNSAGAAFMPHVVHVQPGEDIAEKILSFAQHRPRALCIMSGSGGVSAVTLRQPGSSSGTVTFEGRFEILCLSGSYLVAETGGPRNRTGGVNVSLSSPDGHVIGGAVGGRLVASKPVQVVVCSFVYGAIKGKSKEFDEKDERSSEQPSQNVAGSWPGPKAVDSRNLNTDIDLADG